ncbi:hypothetical protein F0562_034151 [Nyssa sinensis]|uniref:Uncharacterized protein n=1 Tax=Nyssa sinensis TaxID=561372 RepID=A0A5J5AHQ4_9ASTE|nr:hypothetical protein F0562_034151 [Nyssa sinensis]
MAFSPLSHAMINALQVAKQHKSQGISAAASFNGSHLNKYHDAHGVSDSHAQGATAVSNFEDEEVNASTLVAAMHDSLARLTWVDQASSGEFIPKEALDLEEEYGGFSINSEFLFGQDNHFPEVSINGGYNMGGSETVGQTSEGAHPNLCAAHGKAKRACCSTDHTDCTATITSKFNTLASSLSVGNTVPSQHEGLISPSAGVACPSIIAGCFDTAHPPTPNVAIQVQAPSNVDQVQPLQPATYTPPLTHRTTGQPNETDPSAPDDKAKGLAPFYGGPYQTIPSSINHSDTPISVTHPDSITLPLL